MTTITAPIPSETLTETSKPNQLWRFAAAFVAGVVLATGAAFAINAASDDPSPAAGGHSSAGSSYLCPASHQGPC